MTTEIVGLEQHGFVADITCRAGKLQFISQTGFGIRSCVQMDVTDTTQQFIGFGRIRIFSGREYRCLRMQWQYTGKQHGASRHHGVTDKVTA